jgi:transcriptional regulator with XRE-family HTH domain
MPYVDKLKMIKEEKDITNAEISNLSNIPLPTNTRVFNGQTPNPTFETISRIAIALGVSLDELVGLKQHDETTISSPIETTINSYSELLKEKDDRIKELKEDKRVIRNEKYKLIGLLVGIITAILILFGVDIFNGHFGYFKY